MYVFCRILETNNQVKYLNTTKGEIERKRKKILNVIQKIFRFDTQSLMLYDILPVILPNYDN